ncbi:MAG TPA: M13 family metallopeptidase [Acidobacteriaceae bacterium]|nr:M13 family metallopeptidase [Acidobacteriaceae bacterium]
MPDRRTRAAAAALMGLGIMLGAAKPAGAQAASGSDAVPTAIPGFDASAMDTTANPCDDFYQFACGNYAKLHPIPRDLPWFNQFVALYEFNTAALHQIVVQAAHAGPDATANERKIGDYYAACMDTSAINQAGLTPLKPELKRISGLKNKAGLPKLIAYLNRMGVDVFMNYSSQQDLKDADKEIAVIDQDGLGLPEKDYYFRTDPHSVALRREYVAHVDRMLTLLGDPADKARAEADAIMKFETELAQASQGIVERRDPHKTYHVEELTAFAATAPEIDAPEYIAAMGSPAVTSLNVASPDFFRGLNAAIGDTDLATLKAYMRVHLADSFSQRLPRTFEQASFDFYGRDLTGTPQQQARWKRCVNAVDSSMGDALGQLYVAKYFTPSQKREALTMVHGIETAMGQDIESSDWMSPETKVKAIAKLHEVTDKIGYPDKWRSYAKLTIRPNDALGNSVRAREFETAYELNKIDKPVDRSEWYMTPPTVNAYYDPSQNSINFPAGILQPPFYDRNDPATTNYGHIGAVVGHELTHGFDDQGSQYDGHGNLVNWWTPQDKAKFDARTACLVNEYDQFTAVPGLKVNGKLTLGENTADNGGVRLAMMALMARMAMDAGRVPGPAASPAEAKYTPLQQYFIAYAQNWCTNDRPQFDRMLVQTDPHSPNPIRVKGVLTNMPEFSRAFSCKAGQPMDPARKCRVW